MNIKRNAIIVSIIIGLLLFISVLYITIMNKSLNNPKYAYIYQNNEIIDTIDLDNVEEPYTITIKGSNNCYNTIEVRNGSIGIIDASCPDGLCKNMGFISTSVLPITCLPNHLVIELSNDKSSLLDGQAY